MTTPQPKPLSETHPALWKEWTKDRPWLEDEMTGREIIQKCTVDINEHEEAKKLFHTVVDNHGKLQDEVDRLQKELSNVTSNLSSWGKTIHDQGVVEGERRSYEQLNALKLELCRAKENMKSAQRLALAEGERRAMERVNVAMAKACCGEGCFDKADFYKELSLKQLIRG